MRSCQTDKQVNKFTLTRYKYLSSFALWCQIRKLSRFDSQCPVYALDEASPFSNVQDLQIKSSYHSSYCTKICCVNITFDSYNTSINCKIKKSVFVTLIKVQRETFFGM